MKSHIAVVGSINMDLVLQAERMPLPGETLLGHGFYQAAGGKGANQAVAAARMGATVYMIGCVGADDFGHSFHQGLTAEGIRTDYLSTINGLPTGVASICVTDAGENSILLAAGANSALLPAHIDAARDAIRTADFLICQLETPLETVSRAIDFAHEHGVGVILNPAPIRRLSAELLSSVDYLVLNETEAAALCGLPVTCPRDAALAARKLLTDRMQAVLLTMGEKGAQVVTQTESVFLPAIAVRAVDTTAAGDTFVAAFASARLDGLDIVAAANRAQYASALAVTRAGAQPSIPTRAEVEAFIAERG